jgi:hypothetical protein
MKKLSLETLTEGIMERHVAKERGRLVEKWAKTGLLRGMADQRRENMAQMLENQAAQVLREANSLSSGAGSVTSSGQIQGFTSIAFPIVRRVFGGLVANELVSIQPMSLPSGLVFYLDYTYGSNVGGNAGLGLSNTATYETYTRGQSIYTNPAGKGIQSGSQAAGGMYDLMGDGYSKVHSGNTAITVAAAGIGAWDATGVTFTSGTSVTSASFVSTNAVFAGYDPQVENDLNTNTLNYCFLHIPVSQFTTNMPTADVLAVDQIAVFGFASTQGAVVWGANYQGGTGVYNLRRQNKRGTLSGNTFTPDALNGSHIQVMIRLSAGGVVPTPGSALTCSLALADALSVDSTAGSTLTVPSFESDFGTTPSPAIPDIDIKIESIALTATTRKLRARWSPELAQDLNAYQSMDAEVELTQILSENIALEIDREILLDLLTQANGANYYWSRAPGKFLNKVTGQPVTLANSLSIGPAFTGTVREWYETLIETIIDVGNTIQRKTLRGSANFIVMGPDVATIIESSLLYRPKLSIDGGGQVASPFSIGCEPIGTLSNRFTAYKDPYFPRNKILVGFKGKSYLETGYVYAPYVPLIVTPTIFAPEDMTPRKMVMTRYAKKMIRSDFFGTVLVVDLNII